MSKSCETCIFAKTLKPVADPGPAPKEIEYIGLFGGKKVRQPDDLEMCQWEWKHDDWIRSIQNRICTRFPKTEIKRRDDLCGEYQKVK